MISKKNKIFVAGHNGLIGSSIVRKLKENSYNNILTVNKKKLDLTNQNMVFKFLKKEKPKFIFIAAAKVGGIFSNINYGANFLYENLCIQSNLIHGAYKAGIKNLIFLGTSCVYPKFSKQPMKEKYLLNGPLEETNEAYAIAKIAGIKLCETYNKQYGTNYKCLMPSNVFGPNDNYHKLHSHFLAALIKKIHSIKKLKLKILKIWGNGKSKREVIFVDDVADACIFFMNKKVKENYLNIGTGKDYSISQYAKKIINIIAPDQKIKIIYDKNKPNGVPRKLLDVNLAKKYGWKFKTRFEDAIKITYTNFVNKRN